MIREAAMLYVKEGLEGEFEEAFRRAEPIIAGMKGYLSHSLSKCPNVWKRRINICCLWNGRH